MVSIAASQDIEPGLIAGQLRDTIREDWVRSL